MPVILLWSLLFISSLIVIEGFFKFSALQYKKNYSSQYTATFDFFFNITLGNISFLGRRRYKKKCITFVVGNTYNIFSEMSFWSNYWYVDSTIVYITIFKLLVFNSFIFILEIPIFTLQDCPVGILYTIYSSLIFESDQIHHNRQLNVFKLELFTSFLIRFAFFSSRINI